MTPGRPGPAGRREVDEPTAGLYFKDVRKLLEVINALVDQGNSVVVIEHNLEVIKPVLSEAEGTADWVLDLGPEGGDRGGEIVTQGTPEAVAAEPRSYIGGYLRELLAKSVRAETKSAIGRKAGLSGFGARTRAAE